MSQTPDENPPTTENTPTPENTPNATPTHKNIFLRMYYGELSLAVTFWVWGWLIPTVLTIVVFCPGYILLVEFSPESDYILKTVDPTTLVWAMIWSCVFITLFSIPVLVGEWRAANKYTGKKIWATLVKVEVVLSAVYTVYSLPDVISTFRGLLLMSVLVKP